MVSWIVTNRALCDVGMRACPRCQCAFPLSDFYLKGGRVYTYCKGCYKQMLAAYHDKVPTHSRGGFAVPTATRHCRVCGFWMAPYRALWHDDALCAFCHRDGRR